MKKGETFKSRGVAIEEHPSNLVQVGRPYVRSDSAQDGGDEHAWPFGTTVEDSGAASHPEGE